MNQKQKRQRVDRLRQQQKAVRIAKKPQPKKPMTRQEIEGWTCMIEGFVRKNKKVVREYSAKINRSKRFGKILSPIFILLGLTAGWDSGFIFLAICFAIMPWLNYFLYRDRLLYWNKCLWENTDHLEGLKYHLQNFDVNNTNTGGVNYV